MRTFGIVFDFDGVLADTERVHLRAYQEAFAPRGWTLDETAYFTRYLGYNDDDLLVQYAQDRGLSLDAAARRALLDAKTAVFENAIDNAQLLYPRAAETARALAARFPLAIASGSRRAEIVKILKGAGLADAFHLIVSADDVVNGKPAPDGYLAAALGLGIEPSRCLAIEDTHWGITAARVAGLKTVAVTTTSPASALSAADRIVDRIDDVTIELVESLLRT